MADQVRGDISALSQVIEAANSVKEEFSTAEGELKGKIENINSLAANIDARLTDVSSTIFSTTPIEDMIKDMTTEMEQLKAYDEDSKGFFGNLWQGIRNFGGGFTQASVGILEGLGDGLLNLGIDALQGISAITGADTGKYQSGLAKIISYDVTSKATNFVGGANYDENSFVARAGKLTGTLVTYHFLPGGPVIADAAVGALSGYGQQMQKSLREGKTIEDAQKDATIGAVKEAGVAIISNKVFSLGGKAFNKIANSSWGQSLNNSIKNSKVGQLIDKPLSSIKNAKFNKASKKLENATEKLTKAEDGLKAATQKAEDAAEDGVLKKLTTKVGESWNKHKVNSAQKQVALAEEETFRRAMSVGKTDEAIDIAAKRADDLKTSAADASDTFKTEGTKKAETTSKKLDDKVKSLDDDITRVSESTQIKKDISAAEEKAAKARYDMDDAARQLPKEQASADEAVAQAEQKFRKANETFEADLTKQDEAYAAYSESSDKVVNRNKEISEQNAAAGRKKPTDRQANEMRNLNEDLSNKSKAYESAKDTATKSAAAVDDAEEVLKSAKTDAQPENLPSYQKSVQARQDFDAATDDLTKLKAKQGDSDALRQQSMANNPELVAKKAEAEANLTQAKQHVDEVFDHGDVAIQKAEAAVTDAEKSLKEADDALEKAISKDVSKAQKEIQESTSKTLSSAENIMKETQPKINPITRANYNVGQYKNIGGAQAIRAFITPSQSADNVLKSQNTGSYIPSSEDNNNNNNNNNDNITDNGQSGDYDDTPTYPSNTGTTNGSGNGNGYYGPTSSNPVNYDDSSNQFRSNADTTTDNKTDDTNKDTNTDKTTDDASKTDTTTKPTTPSSDTTTITPTTSGPTTSITTPPSNTGGGNEATTGSTNTIHTGGGYTGTGGYTSGQENTTGDMTDGIIDGAVDGTTGTDSGITGALTEGTTSIEDVIKGSKVTKIPTSPSPVTTTSSSSGSSAVIPIAAGLSAAAAAGIGAKAYMDRKRNNDNGEDDEDEFDTDEWSGDDSVDIEYDEDTSNGENYLDEDDDYSYQATPNNEEKYDARSSEELADLQ